MDIPHSFDILKAVLQATPDAIFVKDLAGRYVLVNEAMARFLGRTPEEVVGRHDLELYPEETARQFMEDDRQVLAAGEPLVFEGVARTEAGTQAYLVTKGVYRDGQGAIVGTFGISHDITELRQAHDTLARTREALFQSQKMETVGQLTGGLAHDFNNILSVILGNLELMKLRLTDDHGVRDLIDAVTRAARRGQDLAADLLAVARRRQLHPETTDINALVEGVVRILSRTLGPRIRFAVDLAPEARLALVDAAGLESALLNVALNARDAMPDGGTLRIRTLRADITAAPQGPDDPAPGAYAVIAVEDRGTGMPPDVVARAFEPFFTTKAGGSGSGLGLSMVYGFARQSGGTVTIESMLGSGTTVSLYLPLVVTDAQGELSRTAAPSADGPVVRRHILLVEDDAAVRETVRRQLEGLGHHVHTADSAAAALAIVKNAADIDALLTDVMLGDSMSGVDLAEELRRVRPGLPVVFMSGYQDVPDAQHRIREWGAPLLTKPSSMSQLARAIAGACG